MFKIGDFADDWVQVLEGRQEWFQESSKKERWDLKGII